MAGRHRAPRRSLRQRIAELLWPDTADVASGGEGRKSADELLRLLEG